MSHPQNHQECLAIYQQYRQVTSHRSFRVNHRPGSPHCLHLMNRLEFLLPLRVRNLQMSRHCRLRVRHLLHLLRCQVPSLLIHQVRGRLGPRRQHHRRVHLIYQQTFRRPVHQQRLLRVHQVSHQTFHRPVHQQRLLQVRQISHQMFRPLDRAMYLVQNQASLRALPRRLCLASNLLCLLQALLVMYRRSIQAARHLINHRLYLASSLLYLRAGVRRVIHPQRRVTLHLQCPRLIPAGHHLMFHHQSRVIIHRARLL